MALAINSGTSCAFLRARDLLRMESALTDEQFEELESLLHEVNGTQFVALTSDPQHQRMLLAYDKFARRRAFPILAAMTSAFVISVLIGGALVL